MSITFGLEEIGIPGREYLHDSLTNCEDPLKAIDEFQMENGILLPSLRPMLPLLDLHGLLRLDFHRSVMEELRDKLLNQIETLAKSNKKGKQHTMSELLTKSFPVIKVPHLQPVVMCVLKHLDRVDRKYLDILVADKELYDACDTEVKRQIWQGNQTLFGDEVSPLLAQYVRDKEQVLFDPANLTDLFFNPSPKVRRQGEVVQKLAHMVGHSLTLYDTVLQFLRTLFVRTRNSHYCTLRAELLMALHDQEVQEIITIDPCHKFIWCLDACIREKNVDGKRSRELQGFLDSIRSGHETVLGDISMVLCDPYAINFLSTSALKIMQHIINNESLPRDNSVILLLLRLLALGLQAWDLISSQVFREPRLDPQLATKFLPALLSLMVDDQVRTLNSKLPTTERESAITIIEHSGPPPDAYQAYIQESNIAATLAMYYILHTAKQKDRTALMRALGVLPTRDLPDPFLHTLVALLIPMADEFGTEDFCTVIFDEFFSSGIAKETVMRHLMKLMFHIHRKLPAARLDSLMKTVTPTTQHNELLHTLFETLQEKVECVDVPVARSHSSRHIGSPSPLVNVPTPAAL